jgi:hypothetical protein
LALKPVKSATKGHLFQGSKHRTEILKEVEQIIGQGCGGRKPPISRTRRRSIWAFAVFFVPLFHVHFSQVRTA